jgi:hypothetical protein
VYPLVIAEEVVALVILLGRFAQKIVSNDMSCMSTDQSDCCKSRLILHPSSKYRSSHLGRHTLVDIYLIVTAI